MKCPECDSELNSAGKCTNVLCNYESTEMSSREKIIDISECFKSISSCSESVDSELLGSGKARDIDRIVSDEIPELSTLLAKLKEESRAKRSTMMFTRDIYEFFCYVAKEDCSLFMQVASKYDRLSFVAYDKETGELGKSVDIFLHIDGFHLSKERTCTFSAVHDYGSAIAVVGSWNKPSHIYILTKPLSGLTDYEMSFLDTRKHPELMSFIKTINKSIRLSSDGVFKFENELTIRAPCPIDTFDVKDGVVTIEGISKDVSILMLVNTGYVQPCIGPLTHDNMSGGRWSPSGSCPKKLIIKNCKVICESVVPDFTLGCYGGRKNEIPEIVLDNGELECPEVHGKRMIKYQAEAPSGSTKISELMEYVILHEGETEDALMSDEEKALADEIYKLNPDMTGVINYKTSERAMRWAIELLKMRNTLDVTELINGKHEGALHVTRCAVVLGCTSQLVDHELFFESIKLDWVRTVYKLPSGKNIDTCLEVAKLVYRMFPDGVESMSDFDIEYYYEMIPIYQFDFSGKTHKQCVIEMWENGRSANN